MVEQTDTEDNTEEQGNYYNLIFQGVPDIAKWTSSKLYSLTKTTILPIAIGSGLAVGTHLLTSDNNARDSTLNDLTYTQVDGTIFERDENRGYSLESLMQNQIDKAEKVYDNKVNQTNQKYDRINDKTREESKKVWSLEAKAKTEEAKPEEEQINYRARIEERSKRYEEALKK
ncbi:hypothetical protein CMI38_01885 [Candidatus Pacearchaeota archaeon]|nr:hypothetical protein [Candidatus Pacearchaeota archaeon]|tara:strand:- start:1040 stop:1558 length:519 start_codon:yes stop_codon:yes gene_type:complete